MKILGIEFGSTRTKAVLANERCKVLAHGGFGWENRLLPGVLTVSFLSGEPIVHLDVADDGRKGPLTHIDCTENRCYT